MAPFRSVWSSSLLAVVLALAARGEEPDFVAEPVEITGAGPLRAPGAQATVIDVAQYGGEVRTVSELVLAAPGVAVHATGGPGQAATLSLRGATADQSLVLLDGIPLQGPAGGSVDLGTIPATLLERVVVSRGVLGAQFGAGALGGAVELLPRTARSRATGGIQLSAGTFRTARAAADAAAPLGSDGSALVAIQLDRTSGDYTYARQLTPEIPDAPYYGFARENADARRGSVLVRVAQRLTPATELDVLAQGSMGERGLPGPWSFPTSRSRMRDAGGLAGVRVRGVEGRIAWSARAWGRHDRLDLRGVQAFGDCDESLPDCPRVRERSTTGRIEADAAVALGSHWLKAVASGGEEWISGGVTGAHRRTLVAVALSDDLQLPGRVALHPALRLDAIGATTGLSPALTATFRPFASAPLELRAGWGLSFRPPTFSELYLDQGALQPNPDLVPERAWSVDAGATWRSSWLSLSAGVFWSRYRDLILYDLYPPARVKPFNKGAARIAGAELQAVLQLPRGFTFEASYSFLDAVNRSGGPAGGLKLPYRPPRRLFTRLAHLGDRLEGYVEASFTSAMPRNAFETAYLGKQLLLNAGAGVRAVGPLWLDVEAKNLLDNRTLEDLFQYPLPGFSLSVIARARL